MATLVSAGVVSVLVGCMPLLPLGPEPVGVVDPGSTLIGCERAEEHVVVSADAHLDPACTYTGGFEVVASGTTFDCRGAHVDDPTGTRPQGVHVHAPSNVVLADITVRNCIISGFLNNVRVSRDGFKDLVQGQDYEHLFARIAVENNRLLRSRGSGLFVNGFVTGVTIQDNEIALGGGVGIYLEASSRDNVVRRNTIHTNGFGDVDPVNGVPEVVGGTTVRVLRTGREGIAIDGSRNNVVADNTIYSNAAGGIFLYKNCGEFATERPGQWWERWYGADGNLIEGNRIGDEKEGIWVGSRMAEDQYFMDCSDAAYAEGPLHRLHVDEARGNTLRANTILETGNAIRVEDDETTVEANQIQSHTGGRGILVGTKHRTELLGHPVTGSVIRDNRVEGPAGFESYGWIHGHEGTVFAGNEANGVPATLAAGTQPLINPWRFVIRVWMP